MKWSRLLAVFFVFFFASIIPVALVYGYNEANFITILAALFGAATSMAAFFEDDAK